MVGKLELEEAEETLPEVAFLVEEAMAVYEELREVYKKIKRTHMARIKLDSRDYEGRTHTRISPVNKRKLQVLTEELNDIMEEIEGLGGLLRDIEKGEVDFPSTFQGKDIFFNWRVGEDRIDYWYDKDGGERHKIVRIGID